MKKKASAKKRKSVSPKRVDADGRLYEPGKPLRAPQPWNWSKRTLANGAVIANPVPPLSPDTLTTVKYEASWLEPELRLAAAALRAGQIETSADIRQSFPEVDKRCSDSHLEDLIDDPGKKIRGIRKFTAKILAEASGYDEDTIYRYFKFNQSRQVKKARPGRPRKK